MVSRSIAFLIACILLVSGCASRNTSNASIKVTKTSLDEEPPQLLNAFFGLDKLPLRALPLWSKAPGKDGMPVTFSRRVRDPIDETAFTVITMSGKQLKPGFATLLPADAPDERHTVLLIGELANMPDDPPVTVEVTGSVMFDDSTDGKGLSVEVTPLEAGPLLVLAYSREPRLAEVEEFPDVKQVVVVVWSGGVREVDGVSDDAHRFGYSVLTSGGRVTPIGLGDVNDNDNYEHLYLDSDSTVTSVSMKAGIVMDPRDDPNDSTEVSVATEI